jgi:hypothetical protein
LDRLSGKTTIDLKYTNIHNRLDSKLSESASNSRLHQIFSITTHLGMVRRRATTICIAMQDLELPALVTLEIIDAVCPNDIRMWAKWQLITTVKHFHQRCIG